MSVELPYRHTLPTGKYGSQYLEHIYREVSAVQNFRMEKDKYERRQDKLRDLRDAQCGGSNAELARRLDRDPSYISRLFYSTSKKGYKRIGDDMIDVIETAFNLQRGSFDLDSPPVPSALHEPREAQLLYLMSAEGQRAIMDASQDLAQDAHEIAKLWITLPAHEREKFAAAIRRRAAALHAASTQPTEGEPDKEPTETRFGQTHTPRRRISLKKQAQ